ncbi:MAG: fructosamine kinase family protein [Bacteroidota bacterium]
MNKVQFEHILGEPVVSIQILSGGDIAHAQRVNTNKKSYFVKSGSFLNAKELFEKEAAGLKALKRSKTLSIPEIIGTYSLDGTSCLFLEFIEAKPPQSKDMEHFGRQLARLHLSAKTDFFGFETDNFIGKLPQNNQKHSSWATFYVQERLQPQFKFARDRKLLDASQTPSPEKLIEPCEELFGEVVPSLLHGDLWGGNYLIDKIGEPYLIDPAVYYGHHEVDLAMSKLFGGFSNAFYGAYHEIIPPHENQVALTDIYQLYYLLVHLNLFGTSYLGSVARILRKYFL